MSRTTPPSRTPSTQPASSPLGSVARMLSGDDLTLEVRPRGASTEDALVAFVPLPDANRPRSLVPARAPRAARAALCQFNDGMTQRARLRKALLGLGLGVGLGSFAPTRVVVAGSRNSTWPLLEELRQVFGPRTLEIAVFLGEQVRPNRKPVLQVIDDRGTVLGYAKIGWNELTKRLVTNEARVLRAMAASPPRTFRVPRLLHEADVGEVRVTVVTAFEHRLLRRGPLGAPTPLAAVHEVAARDGIERVPPGGSPYLRELRERLEAAPDAAWLASARAHVEALEDETSDELPFGAWHGDWTPWNMLRSAHGLSVWDWERSGGPVPLGLDAIHHRFLFGWGGGRRDAIETAAATAAEVREPLARLGVPERHQRAVFGLYLIELLLRFEEGAAAGAPVSRGLDALARALRSTVGAS